ncbi:MAG: M20/M25/M40 family metallo-hydrolase [Anaerolineaceae bacterium]|jgi:acetylornithine deacetylase/succinyl-diaminopimelate desuccinylase-like protein
MISPERALNLACELQQIPAPTFQEKERAEYVRQRFVQIGLTAVEIDAVGNTWGCLPGDNHRPLVVSAHLDTVHPEGRPVPLSREPARITGPAIGDNALGMAALICLAEEFTASQICLPGPVYFIATVGEEGIGNLAGMQAVVNRLGDQPIAYIVLEGIGLGSIYHRALGVERFKITVETPGGHSWADYGTPSAIHELAQIITRLSTLKYPTYPRTTMNIGTIQGGTSVNTIAGQASCTLDIRSENHGTLLKTVGRITRIVAEYQRADIHINFESIGSRPAGELPDQHPLVQLAVDCLAQVGVPAYPGVGSTDANIPLSRGYAAVCIGITHGGFAHTANEYILTKPVAQGLNQLFLLVQRAWEIDI